MIVPVILAGGEGSRLWPLSRRQYPKQFLPVPGMKKTFFELTVERALAACGRTISPIVVVNEANRFLVAESLRILGVVEPTIMLEPIGRNTAPAIALGALEAQRAHGTDVDIVVLPSDHLIKKPIAFYEAVQHAQALAAQGFLTTFGVVPSYPETGFGYLKAGERLDNGYRVEAFVEKPNEQKAKDMLAKGGFTWNSGMFLFKTRDFLSELGKFNPAMLNAIAAAYSTRSTDLDFIRIDEAAFKAVPADSVDYAVMEKSDRVAMIELDAEWNDVGSWDAMWDIGDKDDEKNVSIGDVITSKATGNYIHATHRMVAAVGVNDLIVVETADAVLVANRQNSQAVKDLVAKLATLGRGEREHHVRTYRPWGWYETVCLAERFQVKRIMVRPGAALSLQKHHHRAEHWIIVKGTAQVQRGEDQLMLSEDASTYIPIGHVHRLTNPGKIPLEIIEVQTGSYLGEDDIIRLEDTYGRS